MGINTAALMFDFAKQWQHAKDDFMRSDADHRAFSAAQDLAGYVAKSGIKREMEKLRLIRIYQEAKKEEG